MIPVVQRKIRIHGVPMVRRADGVSPSRNYFLVLVLMMILHKAINPEAEYFNPVQVDT